MSKLVARVYYKIREKKFFFCLVFFLPYCEIKCLKQVITYTMTQSYFVQRIRPTSSIAAHPHETILPRCSWLGRNPKHVPRAFLCCV